MEPISKSYALGIYFFGLILFGGIAFSASIITIPQLIWSAIAIYLTIGLILNKLVLSRIIEQHIVFETVFSGATKKVAWLLWPIKYPMIFLRAWT